MKTVDVVQACSKVIDAACMVERLGYFNFAHKNYTSQIDNLQKAMQEVTDVFNTFEAEYKALKYKLDNPGQGVRGSDMEELTEHKKNDGPWPFSKSTCLYCDKPTIGYWYYGTGHFSDHYLVRRFCVTHKDWALKEIRKCLDE